MQIAALVLIALCQEPVTLKPVAGLDITPAWSFTADDYIRAMNAGTGMDEVRELEPRVGSAGVIWEALDVIQVIDDDEFIALISGGKFDGRTVWVQGFDASKLTDDEQVTLRWLVGCAETKAYTTVTGASSTVPVLQPVKILKRASELIPKIAEEKRLAEAEAVRKGIEAAEERRRKNEAAIAAERLDEIERWKQNKRMWTDVTGKRTVEAAYDDFEPGYVWLRKADLSRVKVPLLKLSHADRAYAVKLARERGDLK